MLIGYARVSTLDQSLTLQRDALTNARCERIFEEVASGGSKERVQLVRCLDHLRSGDTLVIWKLDRLGRKLKDLIDLTTELESRGVGFRSITDGIDTTTPGGRFYFHVLGALAEMERDLIKERTMAGLEAARAQGRTGGPPVKLTPRRIQRAKEMLEQGASYKDAAAALGVSIASLYRVIPKRSQG